METAPRTKTPVSSEHKSELSTGEKIAASMTGEDEPMAKKHPMAPGALVWLTYPLLLVAAIFIALAVMGYYSGE